MYSDQIANSVGIFEPHDGEGRLKGVSDTAETPLAELTQTERLAANNELFASPLAIPILNRLRFLVGSELGNSWTSIDEIALKQGMAVEDIVRVMKQLHMNGDHYSTDGEGNIFLAPGMDEVVNDECLWQKKFEPLPEFITRRDMQEITEKSPSYVSKIVNRTGVKPVRPQEGARGNVAYYPKTLLYRLRAEIMLFPEAGEWKSVAELGEAAGATSEWVTPRVNPEEGDLLVGRSGKVGIHFPPEVVRLVLEQVVHSPENTTEEQYYSATDIARMLERDESWVRARLLRHRRKATELKLPNGWVVLHYPQHVYDELRKLSEKQASLPHVDEECLPVQAFLHPLGVVRKTAELTLRRLGIAPEQRLSSNGRKIEAYNITLREPLLRAIIRERQVEIEAVEKKISKCDPADERYGSLKKSLGVRRHLLGVSLKAYSSLFGEYVADGE